MVVGFVGFGVAAATALFATPIARQTAIHLGIFDHPGVGKSHGAPVPYLGGGAILAGIAIGSVVTGSLTALQGMAMGAIVIAAVGFADDLWGRLPRFDLCFS